MPNPFYTYILNMICFTAYQPQSFNAKSSFKKGEMKRSVILEFISKKSLVFIKSLFVVNHLVVKRLGGGEGTAC